MKHYYQQRLNLICETMEGMDEVIYIDPDSESAYALNSTAAAVLELCTAQHSVDEMVAILCDCLPIDPIKAQEDVESIIHEFVQQGLIEACDPA